MPDVFGPFDGLPWAEAQWYRFARTWAEDGILAAGDLALTTSGLSATVGTGRAWVGGAGFERTGTPAANAVAANTHATQFRRDRVVLRRSLTTHTVAPVVIQGAPAASPVAPAISQNEAGDWDLPLWSFLVPPASGTTLSGLVDERKLVSDATLSRLRLTAPGTSGSDVLTVGQLATEFNNRMWFTAYRGGSSYERILTTSYAVLPSMTASVTIPAGRQLDVEADLPAIEHSTGGLVTVRLIIAEAEADAANVLVSSPSSSAVKLTGDFYASTTQTINVRVDGLKVGTGTYKVSAASNIGPRLRYLLR